MTHLKDSEISSTTGSPKISVPYPHLMLDGLTEPLTVVISVLEKGDLPLLATYEGATYKVASIDRSPLNIAKLLRLTKITLNRSETESYVITNNIELLDVGVI